MTGQLSATVERGIAPPRIPGRERIHAMTASDHLEALIGASCRGRVKASLLDLALTAGCNAETARSALAALDPFDHALSVDIRRVDSAEQWCLTWAPVTGIVGLMLDWDLLSLDITRVELSEWLGVSTVIASRALDWLARTPGVTVVHDGTGRGTTVHVDIGLNRCPLTAEPGPTAG
jgi:hypothetical protein